MKGFVLLSLVALVALPFLLGRAFAQAGGAGSLSPAVVEKLLVDGKITLIDVRESNEFDQEHIAGAVSMPLSRFDLSRLSSLSQGKPVVFYCRSGHRSGIALEQAVRSGVGEQMTGSAAVEDGAGGVLPVLSHMTGGITAWKSQRLAHLEKTDGLTDCLLCRKKTQSVHE